MYGSIELSSIEQSNNERRTFKNSSTFPLTIMGVDLSCIAAAVLFEVSNILFVIQMSGFRSGHFNYDSFKQFDPEYIELQWDDRIHYSRPLELVAGIFNVTAWIALTVPLLQLAWILSSGGERLLGLHCAIGALAICGSFTELTSHLFYLGTHNAAGWIATDFNLDNWIDEDSGDKIGWRVLELCYIVIRGLILWVDAIEWLALSAILTFIAWSVRTQQPRLFSMKWALFGLSIAGLCFFDFCANILRFSSWMTFSSIAMIITSLNRLFLLPIWLILLARQLPRAREESLKTKTLAAVTPATTELA
jgi:hypothetical protein